MHFEDYLRGKGLNEETSRQYGRQVGYFLAWITSSSLTLEQITHSEILDFVDELGREGRSISIRNRILGSIRAYYTYLEKESRNPGDRERKSNPALGIHLRGHPRTIPHDLFTRKELDQLYESYQVLDARTHRNKVILGILVYQGLTLEELEKLEPKQVQLAARKLLVPPSGKRNGRTLTIDESQIQELKGYMERILQVQTKKLFQGRKVDGGLKNTLLHLNHGLRRINPKVKNAAQIRQSVITEWLKVADLRTVQYWAGHRYVSSTERYQTGNLEELREALLKYHPLR